MATERYIDDSRGLFGRQVRQKTTGPDMRAAFEQMVQAMQPDAILERIENDARAVLEAHGFARWPIWPHGDPAKLSEEDRLRIVASNNDQRRPTVWYGPPDDAPPAVKYADDVLSSLAILRKQIAACTTPEAAAQVAIQGIALGAQAERLRLCELEQPAERGLSSGHGGAKGRATRYGPCEEREAAKRSIVARFETLRAEHPSYSVDAITDLVARELDHSVHKVRRARTWVKRNPAE